MSSNQVAPTEPGNAELRAKLCAALAALKDAVAFIDHRDGGFDAGLTVGELKSQIVGRCDEALAEPAPPCPHEALNLRSLMRRIEEDNARWWKNLDTGEPIDRNVGEVLCLIHSEISEALEGHRKSLQDDHLPQYKMFTVELADAIIRILDAAAHWAPELPEALIAKLDYNLERQDHKDEARRLANGKKY